MGLLDLFKASENEKLRSELLKTKTRLTELEKSLTPELMACLDYSKFVQELKDEEVFLKSEISNSEDKLKYLECEIEAKKKEIVVLDEELLIQEFGLYEPVYDFASSEQYKDKLKVIRDTQKTMIKNKTAVSYFDGWTVNGSVVEGRKMTNANIKQIIRTFNTECETIIDKAKFNNIEVMKQRINKSFEALNKMNVTNKVSLTANFLELKIAELHLAYEYRLKKQEEKEEQKRIREELREQAKAQKELQEAKKNIAKDITHFTNALKDIEKQLLSEDLTEKKRNLLLEKQIKLQAQLNELNEKLIDIDYRQNNQKAGYVYIISNIGSFGENVYKIGMTRRLDPQDRVDELGDASVPFKFDVHAMIFTEDAPALENALHKAFENKKINMVNSRREFFNVTLEEIERVVKANYDKTVEFKRTADAEQYRESLKIKKNI